MRKFLSILFLLVFLAQIGFLAYRIPQVMITGGECPDDIKLSAVAAGLSLGILYILKGEINPFE